VVGHQVPRTTHTVELDQLSELNTHLSGHAPGITAGQLGLGDPSVPDAAVLVRLSWDGPPEFPYIHGRFSQSSAGADLHAEVHTAALRELSKLLGLHQRWGV
jgi:hypothetical protein